MGIHSVNRDISGCGVEVFALDAADLAAVNSIGKIGVEARKIKVIRAAAYLLIGSKADAQRTVADIFICVDFGAQGDYLGDSRFVVRAEQSGMIGNYKLAPDIFIAAFVPSNLIICGLTFAPLTSGEVSICETSPIFGQFSQPSDAGICP